MIRVLLKVEKRNYFLIYLYTYLYFPKYVARPFHYRSLKDPSQTFIYLGSKTCIKYFRQSKHSLESTAIALEAVHMEHTKW